MVVVAIIVAVGCDVAAAVAIVAAVAVRCDVVAVGRAVTVVAASCDDVAHVAIAVDYWHCRCCCR